MISHDEEHWKEWQVRHRSKKPWDSIPEIAPIEIEKKDETLSTFLERKKPEVIKKKKYDY